VFAIVATGGKQYKVAVGQTLDVERLFSFESSDTKVTDTIGLVVAKFALPDNMGTFQVGAASLTLSGARTVARKCRC